MMVVEAMMSSGVQLLLFDGTVELLPKVERPRARRKMWSMCCSAAVAAGEEVSDSTVSEVAVDARGRGMYVVMNMW